MKKILLASTFLCASATAFAADIRPPEPVPPFAPVGFSWTGVYAGVNAGYAMTTQKDTDATDFTANDQSKVSFGKRSQSGFAGGGQIGFNYQMTPGSGIVVGAETDLQYIGFSKNNSEKGASVTYLDPRGSLALNYFGTVRGRIGYGMDRTLVYATGGFAYAQPRVFGVKDDSKDYKDMKMGWTAGAGIEYALPTKSFFNFFNSSAVTMRLEGLYVNLDNEKRVGYDNYDNSTGALVDRAVSTDYSKRNQFVTVRAALNYKF